MLMDGDQQESVAVELCLKRIMYKARQNFNIFLWYQLIDNALY